MSRPPKTGSTPIARDVQDILRVLNRAEQDESRDSEARRELCDHLRGAVAILTRALPARVPAKPKKVKAAS